MRIALVADAFAPARTSVAVQMGDLAQELAAQGHSVTVIVPAADIRDPWTVGEVGGYEILRIRAPRTKDIGHFKRAVSEFLLPFAMLHGLGKSPAADVSWDGIAWYSPTIFLGPLVSALKRRSQCRTYLILRDLFPDWAVDTGVMRRGTTYRVLKAVERYQYSVADVVGVQTQANLTYMARWADRPGCRLEVLNNWLSESAGRSVEQPLLHSDHANKLVLVYAGSMGVAQSVECFVRVAERLAARSDVSFLFVGRGSDVPRLRALATESKLKNVEFRDEVEPERIPGLLSNCDIGLLALDPRHTTHNIPGKFLTYLRAGLPVLARVNPGNDLEQLILDERVGRVSVGDSIDELVRQTEELLAHPEERRLMGIRGMDLVNRVFSTESAARQIVRGLSA